MQLAPIHPSPLPVSLPPLAEVADLSDRLGCCLFCGTEISFSRRDRCAFNRRRRTLMSVRLFVGLRCRPTPYFHRCLSQLNGKGRVLLCIPCVNWQRRAARGREPKPLLLLDQLILYMLEPGRVPLPDQRCALRLLRSLRGVRPDSDWVIKTMYGQLPLPAQAILGALPEAVLEEGQLGDALVRAWWDYNGRTAFFAHHVTAKLVRRMVKGGPADPLDD